MDLFSNKNSCELYDNLKNITILSKNKWIIEFKDGTTYDGVPIDKGFVKIWKNVPNEMIVYSTVIKDIMYNRMSPHFVRYLFSGNKCDINKFVNKFSKSKYNMLVVEHISAKTLDQFEYKKDILFQIIQGCAAMVEMDIVHNNLTPSNIFVEELPFEMDVKYVIDNTVYIIRTKYKVKIGGFDKVEYDEEESDTDILFLFDQLEQNELISKLRKTFESDEPYFRRLHGVLNLLGENNSKNKKINKNKNININSDSTFKLKIRKSAREELEELKKQLSELEYSDDLEELLSNPYLADIIEKVPSVEQLKDNTSDWTYDTCTPFDDGFVYTSENAEDTHGYRKSNYVKPLKKYEEGIVYQYILYIKDNKPFVIHVNRTETEVGTKHNSLLYFVPEHSKVIASGEFIIKDKTLTYSCSSSLWFYHISPLLKPKLSSRFTRNYVKDMEIKIPKVLFPHTKLKKHFNYIQFTSSIDNVKHLKVDFKELCNDKYRPKCMRWFKTEAGCEQNDCSKGVDVCEKV